MDYVYLSLGGLCFLIAALLAVALFVTVMIFVLAGAAIVGELKPISKAIKTCVIGEKP